MFSFVKNRGKAAKRDHVLQSAQQLLGRQKALISDREHSASQAHDNYSLGYIVGCVDGLAQGYNLTLETDGYPLVEQLLKEYFGEDEGNRLFRRVPQLKAQRNESFLLGSLKGASDTSHWNEDNDKIPMGWVDHVSV
jgi:hypothetical protein